MSPCHAVCFAAVQQCQQFNGGRWTTARTPPCLLQRLPCSGWSPHLGRFAFDPVTKEAFKEGQLDGSFKNQDGSLKNPTSVRTVGCTKA